MILISVLLLQVAIFAGLIFVLKKIFSRNIASATKHIDEMSQDYFRKEEEATKRLEEAKLKADEMVQRAQQEVEKSTGKTLADAVAERDRILAEARAKAEDVIRQADRSREQLLGELDERIARGSIDRACALMDEALPEEFKRGVHAQWVGELIEGAFGQLKGVRVPDAHTEAVVVSAFPLDAAQRAALAKKLHDVLGPAVGMKEKVDPKIVAGIVISVGSLVLDGSLKNRIEEQMKRTRRQHE